MTSLSHPSPTGVAITVPTDDYVEEYKESDTNTFTIGEDDIDFSYSDETKKEKNIKVTIVKNSATLNHDEYTKILNPSLKPSSTPFVTVPFISDSIDSNSTPVYLTLPPSIASSTPEFPSLPPTPHSFVEPVGTDNMERMAKKQKI